VNFGVSGDVKIAPPVHLQLSHEGVKDISHGPFPLEAKGLPEGTDPMDEHPRIVGGCAMALDQAPCPFVGIAVLDQIRDEDRGRPCCENKLQKAAAIEVRLTAAIERQTHPLPPNSTGQANH
jgi:hypothetical protein